MIKYDLVHGFHVCPERWSNLWGSCFSQKLTTNAKEKSDTELEFWMTFRMHLIWLYPRFGVSFIQGGGVGGLYPDFIVDVAGQSLAYNL